MLKLRKPGDKFTLPDNEEASSFLYREAVGLLWFARTGRPDILNAVNHRDCTHVTAVKRIMRYLKGTMDLNFPKNTTVPSTLNLW